MATRHFDQLETRDPEQRELAQFNLLPDLIRQAMAAAPGWAEHLQGRRCRRRAPRARRWPSCRCCARSALQGPAGQAPAVRRLRHVAGRRAGAHLHVARARSSSPRASARTGGARRARCIAAGIRKGDIVHNTFAYHLTPGGWILDSGARALGCAVIAAGPGNTEQQLEVIQALKPTAYVGVPDYLKILLDKAKETGKDAIVASRRRWSAAARCSPRCAPNTSSAASPPTRPTPPPTSASSPTRARRSRA